MQKPRFSISIRYMMVAIAFIVIVIYIIMHVVHPIFFAGTVYAPGYDEGRFRQVRVGMTAEEVEALLGPPLRKAPWPEAGVVIWLYTKPRPRYSRY